MAKILWIDDDIDGHKRKAWAKVFPPAEWESDFALNGEEGLQKLKERSYDAVVLDIQLHRSERGAIEPDAASPKSEPISGTAALLSIRRNSSLQDLCVVIYTSKGTLENAVECLKLGAFEYVQKGGDWPIRPLGPIVSAGIAWHRCHSMRRTLLSSFWDRKELFRRVHSIVAGHSRADRVHLLFLGEDGCIEDVLEGSRGFEGTRQFPELRGTHRAFVERVYESRGTLCEHGSEAMLQLDPLLAGATAMVAAPIPGNPESPIVGVLQMEAANSEGFHETWRDVLAYAADLIGIALEIDKRAHEAEKQKFERLPMIYREIRHSIATRAQVIAMQTRELLEKQLPAAARATPMPEYARITDRLKIIQKHSDAIEGVIQYLREYSAEPPRLERHSVNPLELLRRCAEDLGPRLRESHIALKLPAAHLDIQIQADSDWLGYCLECLLQNAAEAIEEDRRQSGSGNGDGLRLIDLDVADEGDRVKLVCRDSGIGFDPALAEQIFQPLYTTKAQWPHSERGNELEGLERIEWNLELLSKLIAYGPAAGELGSMSGNTEILIRDAGKLEMFVRKASADSITLAEFEGTAVRAVVAGRPPASAPPHSGIGLYSVRRIIQEHGGAIVSESEGLGKGATFTVTLPKMM